MELDLRNDLVGVELSKRIQETAGGVALPTGDPDQPNTGRVIAVGRGTWRDGQFVRLDIEVGQKVLLDFVPAHRILKDGDRRVAIVNEALVLAVIEDSS